MDKHRLFAAGQVLRYGNELVRVCEDQNGGPPFRVRIEFPITLERMLVHRNDVEPTQVSMVHCGETEYWPERLEEK